jgi:photosystem II stability/assembly factor-like uncharacterized protein
VPSGTEQILLGVTFRKKEGWIVGWDGTILHSTDEGKTWRRVPVPTHERIYAIAMRDDREGFAIGRRGVMLVYRRP